MPGQMFFKADFFTVLGYPLFNCAFTMPVFTIGSILLLTLVLESWLANHFGRPTVEGGHSVPGSTTTTIRKPAPREGDWMVIETA